MKESWIKQGGSHPVLFATHLSHTRKFLHRVQAHQLSFTDPDRDRGAQHHGRGEQEQSQEPLHTLSRLWKGSPTASWQGNHHQAGKHSALALFLVPSSQITSTAHAAGSVQEQVCEAGQKPRTCHTGFSGGKSHTS